MTVHATCASFTRLGGPMAFVQDAFARPERVA